jgi:hypothetical protein
VRRGAVVLLLTESSAIINDLDVIVHGFMLQIMYTTVRLFNRLIRKIHICIPMSTSCNTLVKVVLNVQRDGNSNTYTRGVYTSCG